MKLPKSQSTIQYDPQDNLDVSEESDISITLRISPMPVTSKTKRSNAKAYRPIQREDNVIISSPPYRHPGQLPTPTVFVFQPAPVMFNLSGADPDVGKMWRRARGKRD